MGEEMVQGRRHSGGDVQGRGAWVRRWMGEEMDGSEKGGCG